MNVVASHAQMDIEMPRLQYFVIHNNKPACQGHKTYRIISEDDLELSWKFRK